MKRKNIACVRCKTAAQVNDTFLGDQARESGFQLIVTHDTALWLCQPCCEIVKPHVNAIAEFFGLTTDSLSWYALYRGVNRPRS